MIRPASTLCALRAGSLGPEVLMVRRAEGSAFVGGAWVFPGGALEPADSSESAARLVEGVSREQVPWVAAALREAAEEAGLWLTDPPMDDRPAMTGFAFYEALEATGRSLRGGDLAYLSNLVTPPGQPRRFDTRFFVAAVPSDAPTRPDGVEVVEAQWIRPKEALAMHDRREWLMILPTLLHLRLLDRFSRPEEAVEWARRQPDVEPFGPATEEAAQLLAELLEHRPPAANR